MQPKDARTSAAMARVPQKRTTPEEKVAAVLRGLAVYYRRNVKALPGSPDFANVSRGWVIQVHGCFWHQHSCRRGTMPTHNHTEWVSKFARNKERDDAVEIALSALGLRVLTIWECESKDTAALKEIIARHTAQSAPD